MELKELKAGLEQVEDLRRTNGGHILHKLEDISLYFKHFSGELPNFVTKVKDHGRIEKRDYRLLTDLSWLTQQTDWSGLQAVGSVTATVIRDNKTTTDTAP